ncbi:hypothetical protein [Novipirellula caenicola]|uniref:hypothetical protein n=1 Tax=Novipirellula caenicola TaxID=1536901 RepID=UPI0031E87B82
MSRFLQDHPFYFWTRANSFDKSSILRHEVKSLEGKPYGDDGRASLEPVTTDDRLPILIYAKIMELSVSDNKNAIPSTKTEEVPYLNRYSVLIGVAAIIFGAFIGPYFQSLLGQSDPAITAVAKVNEFAVPDQQPVYVPPIRLLHSYPETSGLDLKEEHS